MMNNFRGSGRDTRVQRINRNEEDGLQFSQANEDNNQTGATMVQEAEMMMKANKKGETACFNCGKDDHWMKECPDLTEKQRGQLHIQLGGSMVAQTKMEDGQAELHVGGLKRNYLYLGTCTTNDQMVNPDYLSGVHKAENSLALRTNAGTCVSREQGYLGPHLFWLDTNGIANVVSLKTLERSYTMRYDSDKNDGAFVFETPRGNVIFNRCPATGFPYIDLDNHAEDGAVMLIQTVQVNYEGFTKRQIKQAIEARKM
jgi:hypothetical protein